MSLDGVHPETARRVRRLLADPALAGRYGIVSSVRTYQQQQALYARYKAGRGNLAANPDRTLSVGPGWSEPWRPQGSWHMVQGDGYGHAVDLKRPWYHTRAKARRLVHPLLATYGLAATVPSEWWHVQALTSNGWVGQPPTPDPPAPPPDLFDRTKDDPMQYVADAGDVWLIGPGWHRDVSEQNLPAGVFATPVGGLLFILADLEAAGVSENVTDARKGL